MPEPLQVEAISSADGRLPLSVSIDGEAFRVASIVRTWQVRDEYCTEFELADRLTGGPEQEGRSTLAPVRGWPEGEYGG